MKNPVTVIALAMSISTAPAAAYAEEDLQIQGQKTIPVCGSPEHAEMEESIAGEQTGKDCVDEQDRNTASSGNLSILGGGLLLAGLAAAGGSGSKTSAPNSPDPSLVPSEPAFWRTPEFNSQYGLGLIGAEFRYANGATGQETLGAIYDTGIDSRHSDVGGIRTNISHDYSGSPDNLADTEGHGTWVYGVAGARRNGTGIHGVAPDADFMILKWSNTDRLTEFIDALRRVTEAGADAMNNSWGLTDLNGNPDPSLDELRNSLGTDSLAQLSRTAQAGVSIVFSTGNEGSSQPNVQARLPAAVSGLTGTWIAVTALDMTNDLRSARIWEKANRCGNAMNWCLAAPGVNVRTLNPGGNYILTYGTSIAAPHVTGAILLLKSQHPELTTPEIHGILFDTAYDLGAPGVDAIYGHGALDLRNAQAPQGVVTAQAGEVVNEMTAPFETSWIAESPVTGGSLAAALSEQTMLVTDRYDRGYFANIGSRITTGPDTVALKAGLSAAFTHADKTSTGFGLRMDAFGTGHNVTTIAHMDPVMALVAQNSGTGFSMRVPSGKATLSMASMTTVDASAVSLGAGLPFGEGHAITVSAGHAKEDNSILGASVHGAFAGLNSETFYGRVEADFALGKKATLTGTATAGQTSFTGTGLLRSGGTDTLAMSLGLTLADTFKRGDNLSLALAQPLAISGGEITLRSGTGISPAVQNRRTNRISFIETTIPLAKADRAPELHLGYMHGFDAGWADANFAFGGAARLDGSTTVMAAQAKLTFQF